MASGMGAGSVILDLKRAASENLVSKVLQNCFESPLTRIFITALLILSQY